MDDYQLAQISIMHYQHGMSQQDIARSLGVSKMTISRMLQKARESEIVKISVTLPFELDETIGKTLTRKYGLQEACVVADTEEPLTERLGQVWAFYMGTMRLDNTTLGIGVGNTLAAIVQHLIPRKIDQLHLVQLMGGLLDVTSENPLTLLQETCRRLSATGTYLTSMATVENKEVRDALLRDTAMGQRIKELWQCCQIALFGIGAIERGTLLAPDLVSNTELHVLKQAGAVGDILGHCFSAQGIFVDTALEERLISIPLTLLKKIPERIAVAGGDYKIAAIHGALCSGLVTTLVTDALTANALLKA